MQVYLFDLIYLQMLSRSLQFSYDCLLSSPIFNVVFYDDPIHDDPYAVLSETFLTKKNRY